MRTPRTLPKGWIAAGNHPDEYEMTLDPIAARRGKSCARINCLVEKPAGFGTLMQSFAADEYRGQRLRFSACVKAEEAVGGGLWMRIDGPKDEMLAFDNMRPRGGIQDTTDWERYEVVLDVPPESVSIHLGLLLQNGTLWMDDLKVESVGLDVPLTDIKRSLPKAPQNLHFDAL